MIDYRRYVDAVDDYIIDRPRRVLLAFFVLTLVFAAGLGNLSTDAGTEQFTEDSPASDALDDVDREFSPAFRAGTGSTQLIQRSQNVLSKRSMLAMLRAQHRIDRQDGSRVSSTRSVAGAVARQLDPNATTLDAQIDTLDGAPRGEVRAAAREATADPATASLLSDDFNRESTTASATIGVVEHRVPGLDGGAGTGATSPLTSIQVRAQYAVATVDGDISVFGSGIVSEEFSNIIFDSLVLVVPAAVLLILFFLVVAYRDPIDLVLGLASLAMAVVWTFGFMGVAGIPFTQMLIAVPPLLLAVGIDFGIHAINRYREERVRGRGVSPSMRTATDQLLVAFFIVTGTTVVGFAANGVSDLGPIRDFGMVAAVGIVFTFLIFGVFLPAAKVYADRLRAARGFPEFGLSPLGREDSALGRVLPVGVEIARRAPRTFLALVLLVTVVSASYGAGIDTTFSQDDFLPPEDQPDWVQSLPEPFAPGTYTVTASTNYLEDNFEATQGDSVTIYVEGPLRRDYALKSMAHARRNPPDSVVTSGREADTQSIVTVIRAYAEQDPEFRALVERNDRNDNGVPDDNLERIYDVLLASPYGDRASRYITDDYRSAKVVYTVKSGAEQSAVTNDARSVADRYRLSATATGQTIVFQDISDTIFTSAIRSLVLALLATAAFLVFIYRVLEGEAWLGVINLVPVVVTVALIVGTMRLLGIPFNALTATILSITIGLGIDYSAHLVHRFAEEYDGDDPFPPLERTVRGTGGALTGSVLTTACGIGVLALAITPLLGQFGLVTAVSISYSYLTSLVVTPSAVVVWRQLVERPNVLPRLPLPRDR